MVPDRAGFGRALVLNFLLRAVKKPLEDGSNVIGVFAVVAPEKLTLALFASAAVAEAAGISLFFVVAIGYRVLVRFLHDLHLVLRLAQKTIGLNQFIAFVDGDELEPCQLRQSRERARPAQLGLIAAVD